MNVHVVSQVVRRRQQALRSQPQTPENANHDEGLYFKDTAGLIIFLLVVFVFFMIATFA